MRRSDNERDPSRWRESGGGNASASEKRLASDVRALPAPIDLDDLRLAQIRQRIVQEGTPAARRPILMGWSWARTTAFALAFLVLGGLTTAMAARLYIRRLERSAATPNKPARAANEGHARSKPRSWRMAVREPAQLELSLGPDGAQISVMDGRAEITGAELANPVLVTPGNSWREGATTVEPPSADPAPSTVSPADLKPADLKPADLKPADLVVPNAAPEIRPRLAALAATARSRETQPDPGSPLSEGVAAASASPTPSSLPAATADAPRVEPPAFRAPPAVANDRPQTSMAIAPPRVTRTPTAPPEAPAEAFLVAAALRSLRSDHSPIEALAKLDEHGRRFPNGALQREAALARVEALLGLGRHSEALGVLEPLKLQPTGTDRKVTLARAELRADRGRCAKAIDDLNGILADPTDDDTSARALYGRARCEMRVRNLARARVDLRDYLVRFPEGPQKPEVEALLQRLGG